MDIAPDSEHGFQFPGTFELCALGPAEADLERVLPGLLEQAGIEVVTRSEPKRSSNGKFVSVRISFHAADRAQYDLAHQALRDHPAVKWTM